MRWGQRPRSRITGPAPGLRSRDSHRIHQPVGLKSKCPLGTQPDLGGVITISRSFKCPACDAGICDLPRPALLVSGGQLRPATEGEIAELQMRDAVSRQPIRLPGKGKEGLAKFLSGGATPDGLAAEGFLITCTCGHLFLNELPAS